MIPRTRFFFYIEPEGSRFVFRDFVFLLWSELFPRSGYCSQVLSSGMFFPVSYDLFFWEVIAGGLEVVSGFLFFVLDKLLDCYLNCSGCCWQWWGPGGFCGIAFCFSRKGFAVFEYVFCIFGNVFQGSKGNFPFSKLFLDFFDRVTAIPGGGSHFAWTSCFMKWFPLWAFPAWE